MLCCPMPLPGGKRKSLYTGPSRVSEYLSGKSEPTLKIEREISRKLHIDANIVLGVYDIRRHSFSGVSFFIWWRLLEGIETFATFATDMATAVSKTFW